MFHSRQRVIVRPNTNTKPAIPFTLNQIKWQLPAEATLIKSPGAHSLLPEMVRGNTAVQ